MRILVTGGAGFVGSHIADQLVEAGLDVLVIDSVHPAAHRQRPDDLHPLVNYRWVDVKDLDAVTACTRGIDGVCHQASMVGLGVDFADVTGYVTENDLGTAILLEALHRNRWTGRLVLASSMVVYGEGLARCPRHGVVRPGPRDAAALAAGQFEPPCSRCGDVLTPTSVPEDTPLDPRNVYAATKLHQEHLCGAFAREHPGVAFTALRYHNVYGPRMPRNTPYAGVASIFRSALERGESPLVYEDGGQLRDFIHVHDVARANILALTNDPAPHGVYNIATGKPRNVLEMAERLADAFGPHAPRPSVTRAWRAGDVRHVFASAERAERELGFRAAIDFSDGMRGFATAPLRV